MENGDRMVFDLMGFLRRSNEVNDFAQNSAHIQVLPASRSVLGPTFHEGLAESNWLNESLFSYNRNCLAYS